MSRKLKTRICTKCKQEKPLLEFYSKIDKGYVTYYPCHNCCRKENKRNYLRNQEREIERSRKWRESNPDKIKAYSDKYYKENQDKIQQYKEDNKEVIAERKHRWRENNPDYNKQYYEANKDKINKQKLEYNKRKIAEDPIYKLRKNLRTRLHHALHGQAKNGSAVKDMGCTVEELKKYLESKWQEGMNWENYSFHGWHIDHIIPLANFDLTNRNELLKACHYTNLQPLWCKDNMKKGKKI